MVAPISRKKVFCERTENSLTDVVKLIAEETAQFQDIKTSFVLIASNLDLEFNKNLLENVKECYNDSKMNKITKFVDNLESFSRKFDLVEWKSLTTNISIIRAQIESMSSYLKTEMLSSSNSPMTIVLRNELKDLEENQKVVREKIAHISIKLQECRRNEENVKTLEDESKISVSKEEIDAKFQKKNRRRTHA